MRYLYIDTHEWYLPIFKCPFTWRITAALDVFAPTLANHRRGHYIGQTRVLCIAPTLNKSVAKALRIGLLIAIFSPVLEMTLPEIKYESNGNGKINGKSMKKYSLVFVHFEHFLIVGVLFRIRVLIQATPTIETFMVTGRVISKMDKSTEIHACPCSNAQINCV